MTSVLLFPQSVKQIKPITMENNPSQIREERESNYFPGCRKDANCNCKMCLESITATLDLIPMSVQRSSLTKLSVSKRSGVEITPVSIDPTLLSTPVSNPPPVVEEVASSSRTVLQSTAKRGSPKIATLKKKKFGFNLMFCKWVFIFGLILGLEFGFSWVNSRVLRPILSREIVRDVVQESSGVESLSDRLELIQNGLNVSVDDKLSSCLLGDSAWKVNQLSKGNIINVARDANTTWFLREWSGSVVQFEQNTWMIEYKRNSLLENRSIIFLAVKFTKLRILKFVQKLQQNFWYLLELRFDAASMSEAAGLSIPT